MNYFAPIIEAKSGSPPVTYDDDGLRTQLGYDVAQMRSAGYDPSTIAEYEIFNAQLEQFITHPQFGWYLRELTPVEDYDASEIRVLPLDAIRQEIQELAPGAHIYPLGYMPFAADFGGSAICFHAPTGRVVFADHNSFGTDDITYKDRHTGKYDTIPFNAKNVELAVVPLSDVFEIFLKELLDDRLTQILDDLD